MHFKNSDPKVSVVMTAYNEQKFIKEAIDSILGQTFQNFELIIINDGSNDQTDEIIRSYNDERLVYSKNPENIGLIASLNIGLKLSSGKYIARMDADDISTLDRIEKQFNYLEANPDIGVCGTWYDCFGIDNTQKWRAPAEHEEIAIKMIGGMQICHGTSMFRRDIIFENNIFFDNKYLRCEDYKFFLELIKVTKFANLQEVLYLYRIHGTHESWRKDNQIGLVRKEVIESFLDRPLSEKEKLTNSFLFFDNKFSKLGVFNDIRAFLNILIAHNNISKKYPEQLFNTIFLGNVLQDTFVKWMEANGVAKERYTPIELIRLLILSMHERKNIKPKVVLKLSIKCILFWKHSFHV